MNLDSLSFTLSQISNLVANLSKKNVKQNTQELVNLVNSYGLEADRHFLRCLFSFVDFSLEGNKTSSGVSKDSLQVQLLIQECTNLLFKPALISLLCYAFDHPLHQQKTLKPSAHLFPQLRKLLKLTPVQEVVFGLALQHSSNSELQKLASQFVSQKLPELVSSYVDAESSRQTEGGLHDTTPEVLHLILTGLSPESAPVLWKRLQRDFPRELVPVVLSPLLYPTSPDPPPAMEQADSLGTSLLDDSLPNLISDVGVAFTSNLEACKNMVTNLTSGKLSPSSVALTMTAMVVSPPPDASHSGFFEKADKPGSGDQQWNMEVFITAVKDLYPDMAWRDVVAAFDNPKFLIKDRNAFLLLFSGLRLCFDQFAFPIELFYRRWKNVDGQYSLILQILKNPETFSFADYPYHPVPVDSLKASPDSDNKEVATWRSQDLIEILLVLGEHHRLCSQVIELFKFPVQHCPDVLMLGLLQNAAPLNGLRQELITTLIPTFLGIHPNSAVILHHAWNHPAHIINARPIIMSCMADWYLRSDNDQARLSRILDIAQDLKALTLILASQVLPFVIDLACLASRRGYLKLDKWLTDKIREHGESFISACVTFLQRRCPQIAGQGKEDVPTKGAQLPHETLTTVLGCLQACAASVSKDLSDVILQMIANCSLLQSKARQPAGVLRHRGLDTYSQFPSAQPLETLSTLSSALQGIGMVPGMSGMTSMSGGLGSLVSTPASPSRMLPTAQSPFPLFMNQTLPHPTSGASQVLNVGGVGAPRGLPGTVEKQNTMNMFGESKAVSQEVEDEANSYFQRIYNHPPHPTLSIEEVLEMLKKFMESTKQRERDVFNCMLKNLFEEYQFFPQYPEKELIITAQLLGGIIEHGLVNNYMALGLALRFVLDALRKAHNTKMYYFGITALDRFKGKLKEYAKYCEHVASIPHFKEFPQHLIAYIEYGLNSMEPPSMPEGPVLPPHMAALLQQPTNKAATVKAIGLPPSVPTSAAMGSKPASLPGRPSIANATNIDTLLMATEKEEKMTPPPEALQDKVGFIFNNLSQLNLQTKCDELRDLITKDYWPWMAQYLVLKRATIEFNFHLLYSNFLDVLKLADLNRLVLRETFRNIRVLLRSDKGIANFSDRSLLKNLGHWLGMLTLAKNKPILMVDIDLKSLIIEAYAKGQQELLYVIPFVAKVMESCAKSKVFRPKNPWTMAVMNLLAELHQEQDLKLNLKFEIEVLCKAMDTEVTKLTPTNLLKDPKRLEAIEQQLSKPDEELNPTHVVGHISLPAPSVVSKIQSANEEMQQIAAAAAVASAAAANVAVSTAVITPSGGTPNPPNTPSVPPPSEPRFHVMDLNAASFSNLPPNLLTIPQHPFFREYPHLKAQVRAAVERAVQEWDQPVTERSIKIAAATTENIVRRDFSVDSDESRVRSAAHTLVRTLTGSMAMITCRDHMLTSISTNLKAAFTAQLRGANKVQLEQIEAAAQVIAESNMELACAFIQKAAMEKAIPEIDKRLSEEYEVRKMARSEGRRYCDPAMLTYQAERMPEPIRHQVGGVSSHRMNSVYGECGKTVPGFLPLTDRESAMLVPKEVLPATGFVNQALPFPDDETGALFDKLVAELEMHLQTALSTGINSPRVIALHGLRETALLARRLRDPTSALALLQKAVEGLLEGISPREEAEAQSRYRDAHIRALRTLQDLRQFGPAWTVKNVTRCLSEAREDIKYNLEALDYLVRLGFVSMPQFDDYLAQTVETGMNYAALMFAIQIVQLYLVDERSNPVVGETELQHTINALVNVHTLRRDAPPGLGVLLDHLRAAHDPTALSDQPAAASVTLIHSGLMMVRNRDFEDNLPEKTEYLLREWVSTFTLNIREQNKNFSLLLQQMSIQGMLKNDEMVAKFIRLSAELCITNCSRAAADNAARIKCYYTLDAYVRLIYLLIKHTGEPNSVTKTNLLNRTLGIFSGILLMEHDTRTNEFNAMPYERIFIMLFQELTQPEPFLESLSFQIVTSFCHVFYLIRPSKAPKFAFAWLELIAHRLFIGRIMAATSQQKGWPMYSQLMTALFKFLAPFLRNTDLPKSVSALYKGTLRVLLVLLHDFPEFLCDYHYGFCDVIPSNCIQMRNLILSAFPRNMRLPDPFTPNLKVDIISEISAAPRVVANVAAMITPASFRKDLDSYLKLRAPVTFLSELRSNLQVSSEPGMSYNIQLMNALVLYVGTQALQHIRNKGQSPNMSTIASCAHMDIFQNLGVDLDTEGRYLFLNAIANQLRYPNSHTHYFSCLLLSLFAESNTESIQEQITRVLLERLIVNRPHPWGLLITFIELIKNSTYKFWNHEFVQCAPEIEKLFESVARSCMVSKQVNQQNDNEQSEALTV